MAIVNNSSSPSTRRFSWLILFALTLIAFAIVFIPVWIIQPFKPQTSRGVDSTLGT